jgi:hypothetical protein
MDQKKVLESAKQMLWSAWSVFREFDLLSIYLRRLKKHFYEAILGATLSSLLIEVTSLLISLPRSVWLLVLVGAFFFSSYAAWRHEYNRTTGVPEHGPYFTHSLSGSLGSIGTNPGNTSVLLDLMIYNHGDQPSTVKNLQFSYSRPGEAGIHRLLEIPMYLAISPSGFEQLGEPFADDPGIPPGGKRQYRKKYDVPYLLKDINEHGLKVTLSFCDVHDREYAASTEFGIIRPAGDVS